MGIDNREFDSGKFSEVWSRVMPEGDGVESKPSQKYDEAAQLRMFMNAECEAAQHLTAMSGRYCRCIGSVLCDIADCDRRHYKELRARYFILTGERYCPPELCPVVCAEMETLRNIYITKIQIAEGYNDASSAVEDDGIASEMYAQLAEEEECTAGELYSIITRLINKLGK